MRFVTINTRKEKQQIECGAYNEPQFNTPMDHNPNQC